MYVCERHKQGTSSVSHTHTPPFPLRLIPPLSTQPFYVMKSQESYILSPLRLRVTADVLHQNSYKGWTLSLMHVCIRIYIFRRVKEMRTASNREVGNKKKKSGVSAGLVITGRDVRRKSSWTFRFFLLWLPRPSEGKAGLLACTSCCDPRLWNLRLGLITSTLSEFPFPTFITS